MNIQMVDVKGQYNKLKGQIDKEIQGVIDSSWFIKGPKVQKFEENLAEYLGCKHVISCGNGTDALQIALMALDLEPGDEIIVPAFTYVATAEVIGLLRLKPVMIDVDPNSFNVTADIIEKAITNKTKAIVPVHLFGQSAEMESIMAIAKKHNLFVVEDNAQAIGADYKFANGTIRKTGTIGHIGCTSFYPSKNLGCYGDGGAIFTNDDQLAEKIKMIANHGQNKQYHHKYIGVNSRLDAFQGAVLNIKLPHLDEYCAAREKAASFYDNAFKNIDGLEIPFRSDFSTHVFHQYTLKIKDGRRSDLITHLKAKGIPAMIYYPIPLNKQEAYAPFYDGHDMPVTEMLCESVMSLPIHTEMDDDLLGYIVDGVVSFFDY